MKKTYLKSQPSTLESCVPTHNDKVFPTFKLSNVMRVTKNKILEYSPK